MKRVLLSIVGTVAGLVALLGFKSHGQAVGAAGVLPSAGLPSASSAPTTPTTTGAPPQPGSTATTHAAASSRTVDGQAVQTPYGVVQVQITVSGTKITNAKLLQLTAYDGQSQAINGYAAPILLQETLSAQSANVDTVSGASYTSAGYVQSLQSALDSAGIK